MSDLENPRGGSALPACEEKGLFPSSCTQAWRREFKNVVPGSSGAETIFSQISKLCYERKVARCRSGVHSLILRISGDA